MIERKVRCKNCGHTIGVLKDGNLELKCENCDTVNQWDAEGKRVRGIIKKRKKVT